MADLASIAESVSSITADLSVVLVDTVLAQSVYEVVYSIRPEVLSANTVIEFVYSIKPPVRSATTTMEVVSSIKPELIWPQSVYEVVYQAGQDFASLSALLLSEATFLADLPSPPPPEPCIPCPPNRLFSFNAGVYMPRSLFLINQCVETASLEADLFAEASVYIEDIGISGGGGDPPPV